ncbi:39S ribosomal protein L10, mitochondrial [Plutella xylostella]|uniref:39S ribosomal protein L10, mitochondrial n=1 Tax=Plutella xylostella TaxID=51655 RepID=UPI0020327AE6|nr:39S ribosomal protein L10, mitochondrial [Plutella xylostella]
MASIPKVLLQTRNPIFLSKRFRGKINIQKPRPAHYDKQLLLDLTQPVYRTPKHEKTEISLCTKGVSKWNKAEIDNPFERILAKECLDWFNTSKMVVFLHMNSINMEDKLPIYASLKRNKMTMRRYGKKIISMATTGTRYEAVQHLFVSQQELIFGQPEDIGKLLKILKKAPQMVVLVGIIEDRLMSKNELMEFSQLPNIDVARSQLCSVLQSAGSSIVGQLQQSQQMLVGHLDKHAEMLSGSSQQEKKDKE